MHRSSLIVGAAVAAAVCARAAAAQRDSVPDAIYYEPPGMDRVAVTTNLVYRRGGAPGTPTLGLDVYRPPRLSRGERRPALVFVHGGLVAGSPPVAKDWGIYHSWGRAAAARGLVGITFNHRLNTNDNVAEASGDVRALVDYVRTNAASLNVDPDRVCLAFFSAGGPLSSEPLRERPPYVRCVVLYYPFLDLEHMRYDTQFRPAHPPGRVDSLTEYSPADVISREPATLPPIFLAMAGRDAIPRLNESVARFVSAAVANRVRIDFMLHPNGEHGFDRRNRDGRTREIIEATFAFVRRHTGLTP